MLLFLGSVNVPILQGLQEFSARSSPAHRSLKWPTKLTCTINKEKHCNVLGFFFRKIIVHVTQESSFWCLAFGGFLVVVSAVGRQV